MRRLRAQPENELRAVVAREAHRSRELRAMHRLHAVFLVSLGHSCYEVAHWFGEHPRSVERWVHAYDLGGINGLREGAHTGRPARLTQQQSQQLAQDLARGPADFGFRQTRWDGKLLMRHLECKFGVQLSLRQCQRLLQLAKH